MKKPDAEIYAKTVLWHLAALRAEVGQLHIQVCSILSQQSGQPLDQIVAELREDTKRETERWYRDALRDAAFDG
jgi:hypothetical protein